MRAIAGVVALLAAACAGSVRFAPRLPPGLPDVSGWQRSSGRAELREPRRTIEYELYVSPGRPSVYSLTRYRVTERELPAHPYEKLQWDRDGRDVRRYECVPQAAASEPCTWHEYLRGSAAYDAELGTIVAVYFLHAELLRGRESNGGDR